MLPGPAPCGGRFAQPIPHASQPFLSWLYSVPGGVCRRPSPAVTGYCLLLSLLLCRLCLRPPDVVQQVFQLHPRRLRSFLTSNAALRSRYQSLCPLHPGTPQLCPPPELVHSFRSQLHDVLRQRRLLQHHPPTYRLQIPINVFVLWKVDGEPSRQAVPNPCEFILRTLLGIPYI